MSKTLEILNTLIALKAEADPLSTKLQQLGMQWKPLAEQLAKVLDHAKVTAFTLDEGSVKLVRFQQMMVPGVGMQEQLILEDAFPGAGIEIPEEAPADPGNVIPLAAPTA